MARAASGEVTLKAGGEEYLLRFNISAMMELEDELDMSIVDLANQWGSGKAPRLGHLVAILRHAIVSHDLDNDEAGELFMEHMEAVGAAIGECFERSFKLSGGKPKGRKAPARPARKKTAK